MVDAHIRQMLAIDRGQQCRDTGVVNFGADDS